MRKALLAICLAAILLWGGVRCAWLQPAATPSAPPTATLAPSPFQEATATARPSPIPLTATPLPTPSATSTVTPSPTAASTPLPTRPNLALQRKAMVLEAYGDVDRLSFAPFYDLEAYVNLSGKEPTVTGTARLVYWNGGKASLSEIYLRLYPNTHAYNAAMTIERVLLNGKSIAPELSVGNTVLRLKLDKPLLPGEGAAIEIAFLTRIPRDSQQGYRMLNYAAGVLVLNNFYPMFAVHDGKGWHIDPISDQGDAVYSEVSFYQVRLTAPANMALATSGSEIERRANGDGTATWTLVSGPAREFSVLLSAEYRVAQATVGGTTVRSFYLPRDEVGGKAILGYARDALATYQKHFGLYPYSELDMVEAPVGAGGIESPGLIMMKDEHYSLERGYAEFVAAHEVAHQWWYGLVGNDQPGEPWIDEALANYTAMIYYQQVRGPEQADQALRWYLRDPYQRAVDDRRDMPANLPAAAYPNPTYYEIVYAKGGLFYHELRQRLGDARFFAILQEYAQKYQYGVVTGQELLDFWRSRAGQDINDLIQRWITGPK